ncbi:MAG: cytochrome c biogenesis CcdA family protein [Promethearchaeota archaeon]
MVEVDFFISFFSGVAIGISPCILLMLSSFGASLILTEEKNKFLKISTGLILGMLLVYILMSIIILSFFQILKTILIFNFIFAGILVFIGLWEIADCKKEQSSIFKTPKKVKTLLSNFIQRNSGYYAFLVGIIFVLIKIPCFGNIYLSLLSKLYSDPLLVVFIIVYIVGMLIPIILILVLMRLGLESSKINDFRLKYRTKLRIISGAILIFLAIYLLINQIIIVFN